MNKIYFSAIIMALVSFVACNKEGVQTVGETLSANAYISSGSTKTVYDNLPNSYGVKNPVKVSWGVSESFKAYYDGGAAPVIFSKTAAGTSFTAESVPSGVTSSTTFTGLYGSAATLNSNGKIDIDFSKQNGELDNLAAYDVMTATSKLTDGMLSFAFKHNCAILRLKCVNHTANAANRVVLDFAKAQVSEDFGNAGFDSSSKYWIRLSINLETPAEKGSSEYGKGSVGYRYVIVPAMKYCDSMPGFNGLGIGGSSYDEFWTFSERIDFSPTKYIEARKVYDVVCEAGLEEAKEGGFWAD